MASDTTPRMGLAERLRREAQYLNESDGNFKGLGTTCDLLREAADEIAHLRSALMGGISGPQYEALTAERDALRRYYEASKRDADFQTSDVPYHDARWRAVRDELDAARRALKGDD